MEQSAAINTVIRNALMAAGAALVTNGTVSEEQLQQIVGGLLAVGAVAWSLWKAHLNKKRVEVAATTGAQAAVDHMHNGVCEASATTAGASAGIDAAKATKS